VPPEPAGDVRQDRLAVLELDGERRARKNLFDRPEELEGGFFRRFLGGGTRRFVGVVAAGYGRTAL
jgi:hypothetical protein